MPHPMCERDTDRERERETEKKERDKEGYSGSLGSLTDKFPTCAFATLGETFLFSHVVTHDGLNGVSLYI